MLTSREESAGPRLPQSRLGRVLLGRPRLFISVAVAVVAYLCEPLVEPRGVLRVTNLLVAWNVGTALYVALNLLVMAQATARTIRWRARVTDEGRFVILALVSLAALASMGAIVVELGVIKDEHGLDKGLHLALATLTILSAWVFIHLSFALHYAHEFFDEAAAGKEKAGKGAGKGPGKDEAGVPRGGISFPGTDEPDYWDFLYFAFIIGVAAQTADVSITSKAIRLTSLGHSVLAFFFNSAILALTINIAAGLI